MGTWGEDNHQADAAGRRARLLSMGKFCTYCQSVGVILPARQPEYGSFDTTAQL